MVDGMSSPNFRGRNAIQHQDASDSTCTHNFSSYDRLASIIDIFEVH